MSNAIYMNLSDGSACHGGPVAGEPGHYWLRHTHSGPVANELDALAPEWMRQQAETALVTGTWGPGQDIVIAHNTGANTTDAAGDA